MSLVFHVALAQLLASPFRELRPAARALEVSLAEPASAPAAVSQGPSAAPNTSAPFAPASAITPKPKSGTGPRAKAKPERRHPAPGAVPTPAPPPPVLALAAAEPPDHAVPMSVPAASPASAESQQESAATPAGGDGSSETGAVVPPSFRAAYLHNPEPVYPTASRRLGEEGTVQLRVLVSAEGRPVRVDIHRSSTHLRLDEAAAAALRAWRFVPARRGETTIEATVIVPIVFRLEGEE